MSGSIIDQILNGVLSPTQNPALDGLAQILGTKLIPIADPTAPPMSSMLVALSASLNPIYIGLLFIILAYIGIGATVQSAIHGKFMGQWKSTNTIIMFMLCVVLLSPVPNVGSATLGQYIFVRAVIFGSNFADFALMKVFQNAVENNEKNHVILDQKIVQVSDNLKLAIPMYACAMQLTHMGYGTKTNYFVMLNDICKIPSDGFGHFIGEGGPNYYMLSDKNYINDINNAIKEVNNTYGTTVPLTQNFDISALRQSAQAVQDPKTSANHAGTRELMCYFDAIKNHMNNPSGPIEEVATNMNIPKRATFGPITGLTSNEKFPKNINTRPLPFHTDSLAATWGPTVIAAFKCLKSLPGVNPAVSSAETGGATSNQPWRRGWSYAALAITDELENYSRDMANANLRLNNSLFSSPDPSRFSSSLVDLNNRNIMKEQIALWGQAITKPQLNEKIEALGTIANTTGSVLFNEAHYAAVAANVYLAKNVRTIESFTKLANSNTPAGQLARNSPAFTFINSVVGKTVSASATITDAVGQIPYRLGSVTATTGKFFMRVNNAYDLAIKAANTTSNVLQSIPFAGKLLSAAYEGAKGLLSPSPLKIMIAGIILVLLNAVFLLPQVVMLVVLLLWLAKVAVWFMIIPLATVIIALPNTRAGHDIWKSALSIILLPLFALFFYLVSLFISDAMYGTILTWLFAPMTGGSMIDGAVGLFWMLLTGEIFFRLVIAAAVIVTATFYMAMMIIKGPDMISGALGLRGTSGDIGGEFENLRGQLGRGIPGAR